MRGFVERVFLFVFVTVRSLCVVQGLALAAAFAATSFADPAVHPTTWGAGPLALYHASIRIGATLVVTGLVLGACTRIPPARASSPASRSSWPAVFGLGIVLLATFAWIRCASLVELWQLAADLLEQAGVREEIARGGQNSGLVMLPILVSLLVPVLQTFLALFLVVVPPLLLALLAARSPLLPRLFAMLVATQAGLTVASLLASGAVTVASAEAIASMQSWGESEVMRAVGVVSQVRDLVAATAVALVAPAAGYALGLPFLLLSPRVRDFLGTPANEV